MTKKGRIFWPLLITVLLSDCTTKEAAVESLAPPGVPHEVLGETIRLTLAFNEGAAMGIPLGPYAKEVLGAVALVLIVGLFMWYRRVPFNDGWVAAALALIIGGALGNAWERLLSSRGVVDFIDVGIGSVRFWTFNVADIAVTVGACMLAFVLWHEESPAEARGD